MGGPYNLMPGFDNGTVEFWELSNLFLEAGEYTLTINGDNDATGSLGGTITITPAISGAGHLGDDALGLRRSRFRTAAEAQPRNNADRVKVPCGRRAVITGRPSRQR